MIAPMSSTPYRDPPEADTRSLLWGARVIWRRRGEPKRGLVIHVYASGGAMWCLVHPDNGGSILDLRATDLEIEAFR